MALNKHNLIIGFLQCCREEAPFKEKYQMKGEGIPEVKI